MAEIVNTVRASLPNEPAATRCIFLAGYLAGCQKLPGGLEVFDKAADAFMAAAKIDHDAWELFLEVLVARTMTTADDMTKFRNYVGAEAAAFLAQTAPAAAAAPAEPSSQPIEIEVPIAKADADLFSNWLASRAPLSSFKLDQPLLNWVIGTQTEGKSTITLTAFIKNAQGGPALLVRASTMVEGREHLLADSVPSRKLGELHRLAFAGMVVHVTFKPAAA